MHAETCNIFSNTILLCFQKKVSICLVGQIGANENNRTETVLGAINKDNVGGATC